MTESSTYRFKTIYVFGSIEFGKNKEYLKAVVEPGITLAVRKIDLIYGGDSLGLKNVVTVSANIGGNRVLGVMLKVLAEKRYVTGMTIGNKLHVLSMHERMRYMNHNADAYIVLPRELETLDDIFNIVSQAQLNIHKKLLGLLNVNGFYGGLLSFLDYAVKQGFMT